MHTSSYLLSLGHSNENLEASSCTIDNFNTLNPTNSTSFCSFYTLPQYTSVVTSNKLLFSKMLNYLISFITKEHKLDVTFSYLKIFEHDNFSQSLTITRLQPRNKCNSAQGAVLSSTKLKQQS